ncbi:cadherin-related tumor suppressor isoform X1 [Pieris brassicae]|uniref:cadherin-related tumor suppressor isoform X1 n=2 Tax=Pieris brassicae TaxID=7116 RepID=UPI001E66098C|nr:cadherin-related tumor suppressor isoform X1 [Pieris brassicae]
MTVMGRWHVVLLALALITSAGAGAAAEQMQSRAVDTGVDLRVPEAQPIGTVVGRIPIKPGFTYRFNESPKEFALDPLSGEIKTNTILDRESVDRYAFVVLSSQPTYPIEVRIRVTDVNDNLPEFPEPSIAVAFSESASPGTKLLLDAATDKDLGENGIANDYRIIDGDNEGKFRLNVTVNPSGQTSYLHLETTGKLDRETNDFYVLNISARDGGSPPKYGYLQVNVSILDVNDNPPIFDQSDFSVSLNESVPPGTTVLKVTATDSDLGDNSKITYEVTDTEKQFAVDPESGVITTTKKLSCPQYCSNTTCNMTCVLTVIAKDHGVPRQDARSYVTVNLIDANDHDPVITFTYVPSTANFATVDENAKNGSLVAAITVTDADAGLNGITSISIISGNELNHFRLENSSSVYIVHVNGILDREEISKYNLTVVATDKGIPPRTATAFLVIHVNDVNDHEPVFEKSEYTTVLSELAPPGTYVAGITATDEDTGVNAEIYYDFYDGNQQQWFFIDHITGLVTTKSLLDREIQGSVELNVSARDGGPNPKWAYTRLKVTILDENDEAPTFPQTQINASLAENIIPVKEILILTASDYDQGTNGSVSYYLPPSIERKYPKTFVLDHITGQLSAIVELDREKISTYEIQVIAKDQGFPPQSSTATVLLQVLDVNDNDPYFYPLRYVTDISGDLPLGSTVIQVKAFDEDDGDNAKIIYSIESGGDGYFDIEPSSGNIILQKDFSKASKTIYSLKVSCKDKGNRRSAEDAIVEIIRKSQRKNLDFDKYGGYNFKIVENEGISKHKINRFVGRVSVRKTSDEIFYYIIEGDPKRVFKINENTGTISAESTVDREEKVTYHLKVMAKSGLAYGFTTVNISVLDVNDNYPTFIEGKDEIHIAENMAVGQEVYFARAIDRDSGSNRTISYALSYNSDNSFRISETTGVIYLNKAITNEPGSTLSIEVTATDHGKPALATKYNVIAIIDDVNDHTPVFDHTSYETSLLESTLVNTRFFAISASDADLGPNGQISYIITEGNTDGKFGIFPDGYLYVKSLLDREEKDYYSLTIIARDNGAPPRSSQVPVVVHVLDENDNSPQFTNTTFVFKIKENEPPDTFVGKLTAIDKDIGRNAELTFSLPIAQNDFRIDSRNGFIKTLRSFDRESLSQVTGQNYITLTVTVSDNGKIKLSDSVRVTIYITDVNDNAPTFTHTPYAVEISEGASVGASVTRIYSTDADEGLNGDIYYRLIGGDDMKKFILDEATGQLFINRPLDRETLDHYKLLVMAHDSGQTVRLSATTTITVNVLDENDNVPVFSQTDLKVSVLETEPINKKIIQFHANDADLGINNELQYSISSGNRKETFFIDSYSGELFLHKHLDYEDLTMYVLNITVMDNGSPSLSSSISFTVNVIDANDNAPVFTNTAIVRQIREGIPRHTPIVTVTAEDPDSGLNGKVWYSIIHQEPNNGNRHFAINNVTGVIHTLLPIDRESVDTFRITVVAYDRAEPQSARLSAEKLVTVIVEDINDNAPVFVSMNAAFVNSERLGRSAGRGIFIMNVLARDLDSGTNGLVTYKLIHGGNDMFDLHRSNGALSLRYPPASPEARWNLVIKATDEAVLSEQRSTETYLTLIMGGTELQGITWTNAVSVSVAENEPAGTAILNMTNNYKSGLEYYIVNVTGDGRQVDRLFDIDSSLGILSTAVPLDREAGIEKYEVEVCAVSSGSPLKSTTTKVEVVILDRNDSPPEFKNIPAAYTASEDLTPGQIIARITAEDPDTIGTITYSIQSDDTTPFLLDRLTGDLSLKEPLDRETTSEYEVVIRADDGMQFTDVTVVIQVTDTNDNPPVFKESAYSFDIAENAARGSVVGTVAAIDPDAGLNAQLTYTVISDWANDIFSLNPQTGVFTLTARLDYEETPHYILVTQAQDNGQPSLSGTVTIYINVIDLNDNAPIFDPMSFSNEILENVPIGTPVVTVSATDLDSGWNGKLSYSITSGDENSDFTISSNGTIHTANLLDREKISMYNLIVIAKDLAKSPEPQLSSTVQVTIQLKDVNDMAPEFLSSNSTAVSENIPLNTVIMTIKAIDKDEGRNGYVEYFMDSDPEVNGYFSLGNVDGILRATGKLDRELKSSYTITVKAKDRGDPPQITSTKIDIKILDENDNSPVFDPKQYSASVPENASIGASVLQVSATDIDEDSNGRVRYSIDYGDDNRDFSISEDTGIVRVAKNLNFERKSRYILTIRAEDCAKDDVRFDTAELSISLQDINDNPPTFLDSPYLANVMENVIPPNGGFILTVHAYDADSPPFNNQVRYFIKEGDADLFKINASSGQISLLRTLDREAQDEYTLSLVAMDTGSPPLTGSGTVKVIVQDVNDNSPDFERQNYKAHIKENSPSGTFILGPKAIDNDIENNAKIRYSLLGDKSERFSINSMTGTIMTNDTLDREEWEVYYLIVMAQDSSTTDPRTATANVTIIVDDENDNTPTFTQKTYEVFICEKTKPNDFVFGVKAKDNDIGLNKKIVYDLKGEHKNLFNINQQTGVIKANEDLSKYNDRSRALAAFNLVIVATDSGTVPQQSMADLILIPKSGKNFPQFTITNKMTFTFPEDTPEGVLVTRLSATSPKKGALGLLQYSVAGGNVGDALRVEPISGEVFITGKGFDYETMPLYDVWFEVKDSDNPPLKSFIEIEVKITDANDNAPVIEQILYNATVSEEESPPQTVVKINAHDDDSDENGRISFRLLNDYEETFVIDSYNGEIYTNIALDRESIPFYEIIVEAVDHGTPQLTGTSTVLITVADKNDNPPRFTRLFSVNVTENAEIGSFVIRVTSSDQDIGPNANATYSFVENPGEKFVIDSFTGNVTVARPLDREMQDEYILKVAAIDGAWRSETPLTITIQDQNDNAPEFEYSYYSFNFPELQKKNSFVGQVIASDKDKQGPNSIISYSLQQTSDLFSIDPATGEILSKFTMNYKRTMVYPSPENSYSVTVVATDNGKPPMSSECLVTINIVDANNNKPKFEPHEKLVPVPYDALIGEKIINLEAKDTLDYGINAEIEYYVFSGNGTAYFTVDKISGWVIINKQFHNVGQFYNIKVKAIDRGVPPQQDETSLIFVVTGENINSPKFTALSYQVIVPENEPIGSSILTLKGNDEDDGPNGIIRYEISSGNEDNVFKIHPVSGVISILRSLDYDEVQEYRLNITARDLGFKPKEATATVTIILTDINDNAPVFNQTHYQAYLPENSPIDTFIFEVRANDIDSPKNAIVKYKIKNKITALFYINENTGKIYSKEIFDYEEKNTYKLQILAENPNSTMQSTTEVIVQITGVNEFYPKFVQPVFHFDVSESAEVGTNVGVIQASDQDSGEDGVIYYLFVGSSNDKGFNINSQTGVIRVARYLDRETQNRVVLTVLAKNYGSIHGNDTDEAQVIISIQDGNDPPVFLRHYYETSMSEGANIGQNVIEVQAVDKDVRPQNNQFSYSILSGNDNHDFKIDPQSGLIEVSRYLDREKVSTYSLTIGAIDTGVPPQTGTTTVKITLTDINDNGPIFDTDNFDGSVYENEPPNTSITTLSATDPDLPPNGAPFSYKIIGGKHQNFVKVHKHTGVLLTTKKIDRELTPYLEIDIQIEDSGNPVMTSNYTIQVKVLDRNDNPPTPRSVHVLVYAFNNKVPMGKIADVKPNDLDVVGDYKCKIIKETTTENTLSLLTIRRGCDLYTNSIKPGQGYSFSVSGNDGIHRDVISSVSLEYFLYDNETVEQSVTLRILNITATSFLTHYYRILLEILKVGLKNKEVISIYSINESKDSLDLTIAIKEGNSIWKKENTEYHLKSKEAEIKKGIKKQLIIPYFPCYKNPCHNSGICSDAINVINDTKVIESSALIIASPAVEHDYNCLCNDRFVGKNCEKRQDPCSPNPCKFGGLCRKQGHDFMCSCPARHEGKTCELERDDACSSNPCKNGGSCKESSDRTSYFCLCRPGYRGNQCEGLIDSCRPNPCLHGGICISLKPGYKCSCTNGRYGTHCESSTFGFNELSYMQFPALDASTNDITLIFATTKADALLLYNYGAQTGGRSDFIAIELLGGKPVFSFGGARTSITTVAITDTDRNLADGKWYKLTATRNGRVISLSIASCTDHGDICTECEPGDKSCYDDATGQAGTLNFNNEPLLIGGLEKADPALERPGQIHSDDFVGCMHSISVNGRLLNLTIPLKARGVEANCDRSENGACYKNDICGSGECVDRWKTNYCKCGGNIISSDCGSSLQSISVAETGFLFYTISEKHRRMQLLESFYGGSTTWDKKTNRNYGKTISKSNNPTKTLSFSFKSHKPFGLLFYAATDKYYTLVELIDGKVSYTSKQSSLVNMTQTEQHDVSDGNWHNVTLYAFGRSIKLIVDNKIVGEELDAASVHDFLDPYLTVISLGGVKSEWISNYQKFEGCLTNFTVNHEIQPFTGNGSIFKEVNRKGKVISGCHSAFGAGLAQNPDPLSIGITLVISFFIILIVAILVSFIVFRLRKQKKEKNGVPTLKSNAVHSKQNGGPAMLNAPNLIAGTNDNLLNRNMHTNETSLSSYMSEGADIMRNVGHIVGPELLSKKYKDREIMNLDPPRPQRPDIIEREVVGKSPALRDDHHVLPPTSTNTSHSHNHEHPSGMDLNSEVPEHYDLENASSIAPSDIDIVYHYKGFREAAGVRKYKATPPPIASYHHKHQNPQHRHSPHHSSGYPPRALPQASQPPPQPRQHQTTPLARLSPSSELSQQPRILTLHDISGKPLQSALLATTSSSGGVGKDALHSNSERSLNSPVMSQLSGQSSSAGRKTPNVSAQVPQVSVGSGAVGLTAEEIERMNARQRTSSLVSTLDAVSSSSEAPRSGGVNHHMSHRHHSPPVDNRSSTGSDDESGNDSFTCSEIEYDNNSLSADKPEDVRRPNVSSTNNSKKPILPPPYESFDSSFRGSLSTLVASDDDIAPHVGAALYRQANGSPAPATLGWDYHLNWGLNFESMIGVFKDIAELPDSVNGRMSSSLRLPNGTPKPSEEYV